MRARLMMLVPLLAALALLGAEGWGP